MRKLFNGWGLNGKKELKRENEKLKNENKLLLNANKTLMEQTKTMRIALEIQEKDKSELKNRIHKEQGAKGGLVKEINKLKKENVDLRNEIENFKKTHWLIKEIPSGRLPSKQRIRSNAKGISNQVRKLQEEIAENKEK